jgi:putative membrane protein
MKIAPAMLTAALALALSACGNNNDERTADETVGTGMAADPAGTSAMGTGTGAGVMGASDTMGATGDTAAMSLADGDRKALGVVQEVDRHEIAAATDALSKGVQGDVRSYAETLRDDHTRNLETTQRLLGNTGAGTGMAGNDGMTGTGTGPAGSTGTGTAMGTDTGMGTAGTTATDAMAGNTVMSDDADLRAMREKHDAARQRLSQLEGEAFATAWIAAMVQGHEEALAELDNELIPNATDAGVTRHLQTTRTAIAGHLDTARSLQSANR